MSSRKSTTQQCWLLCSVTKPWLMNCLEEKYPSKQRDRSKTRLSKTSAFNGEKSPVAVHTKPITVRRETLSERNRTMKHRP